ncbi:ABC transporter substrate-binding protein [Anaerolentibacter hominis]|uniref:ABC transporter substrate-binding protein n=1 Tax=Anaerolentibacter hominis TaxID=3079009 RepID=UPI0031B848E4
MKSVKKIMALLLVLVLAVSSMTGCSKEEEGKENDTPSANDGNDAADDQGSDAADGAADGENVFLIGSSGPLTGQASSYGISVKQGAEVAINEINEAGGVKVGDKTYTLKLQMEDDEATEDKAITAYNTLMDAGMNAFMGTVTTGACLAVIDSSYADGILQLTPSASAAAVTEHENSFRLCFTDPLQGITMADFAYDTLGLKTAAVLYTNAEDYSSGMMEAFVEEFEAKGGKVLANEVFGVEDVDFTTQLTKIKKTNAECIFVPYYYQAATYITKQAKELGIETQFLGGDGWDGVLGTVTDTSTVEGAIFLSPFFAADEDPLVKSFVEKYQAAYNATPDQFAADGYDCVYVIKAAMEKAGSIEGADLIAAMPEISIDGLTGKGLSFTPEGEPNKAATFIKIVDGAYTSLAQ